MTDRRILVWIREGPVLTMKVTGHSRVGRVSARAVHPWWCLMRRISITRSSISSVQCSKTSMTTAIGTSSSNNSTKWTCSKTINRGEMIAIACLITICSEVTRTCYGPPTIVRATTSPAVRHRPVWQALKPSIQPIFSLTHFRMDLIRFIGSHKMAWLA